MNLTLGTQLRHLLELLDGAVEQSYLDAGLSYRPRYTPVMRVLIERESATIGDIAEIAHITQPAATQTIALMINEGLVSAKPGAADGRQRLISLTDAGRKLLPRIQACWQATAVAATSLEADLPQSLSQALAAAIATLETKPFGERIALARSQVAEIQKQKKHQRPKQPKPKRTSSKK